jgi:hypothetical protein
MGFLRKDIVGEMMPKSLRILGLFSIVLLLATQYQNCSSYNDNTLFDSKDPECGVATSCIGPTDFSELKISVSPPASGKFFVDYFEDQLQITGTCSDGFAPLNLIEARVKDRNGNEQVLFVDASQNPYYAVNDIHCENGKFFALIPLSASISDTVGENFFLTLTLKTYNEAGKDLSNKVLSGIPLIIKVSQN